ncbi:MAG: AI-2E family transporter [Gammaproteobacteria bacterium]|nr:MAG: AI-2E family transporter [Gammaproteobacteria bacterium]RKZ92782.1 MAG: AI-2E family transporter [Gammaproteobacteria bacterium]RKZ97740.1 MAG: AI-2E family transporter [Gammaproteobacteria bacterium]
MEWAKMNQPDQSQNTAVTQAIEIAIRLGLIFLIVAWCLQILMPFISIIVWGAIIAVAVHKPFLKLTERLGERKKLAATLISVAGIVIILIPVLSLSSSLVHSATSLGTQITDGTMVVPAPSESISSWPLIGEKVYLFWSEASVSLAEMGDKYSQQISAIGVKLLSLAASVSGGILQFVISMMIAGAFLSSASTTNEAMTRLANRLAGDQGKELLTLSTATVRSVAVGVLGIAVIQGILAGLGMMFAGVPAAGLIAFIVLIFAIAQLPPILVLIPVIFYVFSVASTTVAVIFMIWSIMVSLSDMVLKPLLLGRGVDAPMLVILLGAIGGMIMSGIVGLFTGAIILALGYKLFQAWVVKAEPELNESTTEQVN